MNYEQFQHPHKNIFLVTMTKELNPFFSEIALQWIKKYLIAGKRIALIVNKKWYSAWVFCRDCWHVPQCKHCSVSIRYHKIISGETIWLCHICKNQYPAPLSCPECWSKNITEYGIGTQKIAEYLEKEFWKQPLIIESETVWSSKKVQALKKEMEQYQLFVWTSLLTQPPAVPVDLVVFLNADLWLNIPDYTSAEKNFLFLYEAFLQYPCKNFIVQSFAPQHYSIRNACRLDKDAFLQADHTFRKNNNYPPFADICVLLYKNEIEETVFNKVDKLYKELLYLKEKYGLVDLEIYSTPPLVYKMFWKYRYNIILKWKDLRNFMDIVYSKLHLIAKWFKVDRAAESIV